MIFLRYIKKFTHKFSMCRKFINYDRLIMLICVKKIIYKLLVKISLIEIILLYLLYLYLIILIVILLSIMTLSLANLICYEVLWLLLVETTIDHHYHNRMSYSIQKYCDNFR